MDSVGYENQKVSKHQDDPIGNLFLNSEEKGGEEGEEEAEEGEEEENRNLVFNSAMS